MIRMDLGPSREWQNLSMQLDRGRTLRGNKAPEAMLKAMYGTGGIPNPMAQILRQADTLKLTGVQADSLATMNRSYVIRLDSIWAPIAKDFAALADTYDKRTGAGSLCCGTEGVGRPAPQALAGDQAVADAGPAPEDSELHRELPRPAVPGDGSLGNAGRGLAVRVWRWW